MADGYTDGGTIVPEWWVREVNRGKAFRKLYAREDRWDDWRRWYRGEWRKGILPSNVYFKMLRTLIPRVYYRNPSVSLTPKKPGLEQMLLAKLLERADNTLLDAMGIKEQMKRAVQWTTMFGTSGIRLGYGAEFTPTPDAFQTSDPDTGGKRVQRRVEYNDLVHPNAPWALAAHPGQTVVPANTVDIHSARWVCYEVVRPLDDVVDDPRFENTKDLATNMRGGSYGSRGQMLAHGNSYDRMRDGVLLWEIRDKKTGIVFVMAPFANAAPPSNKVLFRATDDLQIRRRLNYYPLIFNTDDEVFWGVPDSQIIEPQQVEKNEIRTQQMYHRRAALTKFAYEAGSITPDELSKMLSDDNAHIGVQVKNINGYRELPALDIPRALIEMDGLVDHEVQEILGLGVNQFGEYAPGSADRTAREAGIVDMATRIRVDERRDSCADLLTYLVQDMNHLLAERWDTEMIFDIAGPMGVPIWLKFQPTQLSGHLDYDVKVDPDTSLPQTKELREAKAEKLYSWAKDDPFVEQMNLRKFVLNEVYGVDADFLLKNPAMQTTQEQPMEVGQAAQALQGMGSAGAPALQAIQGGRG